MERTQPENGTVLRGAGSLRCQPGEQMSATRGEVGDLGDKGLLSPAAGPALRLGSSGRADLVRNALYLCSGSCSQRLS